MTPIRVLASLFCLLACQTSRADLTLRHSIEVKFGAFLPPEAIEAIKTQMASGLPNEVVTRVKGDKVYTKSGPVTSIMDCSTDQITLLNAGAKKYATVPMADYPGTLQGATMISPAVQKMFQDLKFDVQTKKTGRAGLLQGIRADEHEIVVSVEMPGPQHTTAGFVMTIQQWIASPEETGRVPAIGEFAGFSARVQSKTNSYDVIQKVFSQFPGMGEKLGAPLAELMKRNGSLVLKMHVSAQAPAIAQLFQQMKDSGDSLPAGFDPGAPLFEFTMDLAEISTAAIPDAVFATPADYQTAPMEELLKAAMPHRPIPGPKTFGQTPPPSQ